MKTFLTEQVNSCCSICCDEGEEVLFFCSKVTCEYQLCGLCIKDAFKDSSGSNSTYCQFCKTPSALDMISAVIGTGAIKAVEKNVRSDIEFELKVKMEKKEAQKRELSGMNDEARVIFNKLSDEVNLKCPRCQMAFHDYDGCNALQCSSTECRAAFCAICLEDCGSDAHDHVRSHHGDLFDKKAFEESKRQRTKVVVESCMEELSHRPFELKQLVQNHIDKAELLKNSTSISDGPWRSLRFIEETRASLLQTIRNDRLSLLTEPSSYRQRRAITKDDLTPRCSVPEDFRIEMKNYGGNVYSLNVLNKVGDKWKAISLEKIPIYFKDRAQTDIMINIIKSITCAVIAFENENALYQSTSTPERERVNLDDNQVCMTLKRIGDDGGIIDNDLELHQLDLTIIGYNPNFRMITLEKHVVSTPVSDLLIKPLKHLVGDGMPMPILTEISKPLPSTYTDLNEEQKKVAHPLRLKTAMEVGGPPGTGKTKTIVELIRSLLECTDLDIIVLSERNGAIDAIAEKIFLSSLKKNGEDILIKDPLLWLSVLTYGCEQAIGDNTKLFTLEEKLRCVL